MNDPPTTPHVDPYACHACGRAYPTLAALRVHTVVDEHRVATPAERARSKQTEVIPAMKTKPASERSRS